MKIFENVKVFPSVVPVASGAATINGTAVDTEGYGDGMAIITVGATTGTPTSFTVDAKVQESDNGTSGWTDISGAALVQVTTANKQGEIEIPIGSRAAAKRYVRVVVTNAFSGGSTPTAAVGAVIVLADPERISGALNSTTAN